MTTRVVLGLVHYPTLDRKGTVVAAAVTSLDLHDLARLARTYGLGGVYVTTPLDGQRALARRLLSHWVEGRGGEINPFRREALETLRVVSSLQDVVQDLTDRWGRAPQLVATSAREGLGRVTFEEARDRILSESDPVLLLFGTGWGLAPEVLGECHWILEPIHGKGAYNHLSVRSAASIVVDRLFRGR